MATIKVKNSVTSGSDPTGLTFGELAVNITDKKIYVGNVVGSTVTLHDQQNVVTSVNGVTGAVTNIAKTNATNIFSHFKYPAGISSASILAETVGGDEGGQVDFGNPITNTSLTGGVAIDIYQNKMRFFEKGGSARGYYIDLTTGGAGVGTNLVGGSSAVTSVSGSGNGISVSPTTGAVIISNTGVHSIDGATGAITNVARLNEGNTFSVTQVMNAGATMQSIYVSSGVTLAPATITLSNANPTINGSNSNLSLKATASGLQPGNVLLTMNGADIDVGGVPLATLKIQDPLNGVGQIHLDTNGTSGVVGITGAVSVKGTLSSTGLITASAGISATSGTTFTAATVYITNSTANVDPLYVQHSSTGSLKVSTTGQGRSGFIRLGNSTTANLNTFIGQADGTLTFYNGLSNTGSNMISFSSSAITIPTTISGATFSGLISSTSGICANAGICGGTYMSAEGGYRFTSNAIKALTGTTYTLLVTDDGKIITTSNASQQKIEIPTTLPIGFNCSVIQLGTGPVGFSAAGGVTINSFGGKTLMAGQYSAVTIIEYASNIVNIAGGLTT